MAKPFNNVVSKLKATQGNEGERVLVLKVVGVKSTQFVGGGATTLV